MQQIISFHFEKFDAHTLLHIYENGVSNAKVLSKNRVLWTKKPQLGFNALYKGKKNSLQTLPSSKTQSLSSKKAKTIFVFS